MDPGALSVLPELAEHGFVGLAVIVLLLFGLIIFRLIGQNNHGKGFDEKLMAHDAQNKKDFSEVHARVGGLREDMDKKLDKLSSDIGDVKVDVAEIKATLRVQSEARAKEA